MKKMVANLQKPLKTSRCSTKGNDFHGAACNCEILCSCVIHEVFINYSGSNYSLTTLYKTDNQVYY